MEGALLRSFVFGKYVYVDAEHSEGGRDPWLDVALVFLRYILEPEHHRVLLCFAIVCGTAQIGLGICRRASRGVQLEYSSVAASSLELLCSTVGGETLTLLVLKWVPSSTLL